MRIDSFCRSSVQAVPATVFVYAGRRFEPAYGKTVRALVCACGNLIQPGRLRSYPAKDCESFQKSFKAAQQYREQTKLEAIMRILEGRYASKPQLDELAERITNLQTILKEPLPPPRKPRKPRKPEAGAQPEPKHLEPNTGPGSN
jgi:hypothetical protein